MLKFHVVVRYELEFDSYVVPLSHLNVLATFFSSSTKIKLKIILKLN